MNTTRIGRSIAAVGIIMAAFAVTGCGVDFNPPSQDINLDRSGDTGKGVNTGDNKLPPDSRP